MANQIGSIALQAKSYERAESLLLKANSMIPDIEEGLAYSHLYYNLGNLFLARKDHFCALSYYQEAVKVSPYRLLNDFKDFEDLQQPRPRLNS